MISPQFHEHQGNCGFLYEVTTMNRPWEDISLSDYEKHMSLGSVMQLQALNTFMKEQFSAYPADTAIVLGVAGGNGLEHIIGTKLRKVYGIDINADYLRVTAERYAQFSDLLELLHIDLVTETNKLPKAELVIADLLIEYIGLEVFKKTVKQIAPKYVSCVIQINTDDKQWVSDSPYIHAFDRLDEVHHQMDEDSLTKAMADTGYERIFSSSAQLPNGKALVRLDYRKQAEK